MREVLQLLKPYYYALRNRIIHHQPGDRFKSIFLALLAAVFWAGIFIAFLLVLRYFTGVEIFGDILARKLLAMVFITFLSILLFSNTIAGLSTLYLSNDLQLTVSLPVSRDSVYYVKFAETLVNSSWMVIVFALPVFLAYAVVYKTGVWFFLELIGILIPFLMIPAALGIILITALVLIFPARRTRDILFLLGLIFFVILFFLFRFLRPERLVDPDQFAGFMQYLAAVETPTAVFLPSYWATEALAPYLFRHAAGHGHFYLLLLISTALALMVLGKWFAEAMFFSAWSKAQEAKKARLAKLHLVERIVEKINRPRDPSLRAVMIKDIKTFFRDTTQWSQLFLLAALVVVYIYNFSVLPLEKYRLPTYLMQNIIAFINLGLAGFVMSAVAVRFVFPAVSLEGEAIWIIKSSPLSIKNFLWSKFWVSVFPLIVLAEFLVTVTNYYLHVSAFMMILSVITIFFMTLAITSLGVGLGAIYPRFQVPNAAQISVGFGGIVYMIISMIFIGVVVAAEARPTYVVFLALLRNAALPLSLWLQVGAIFMGLLVFNILALWLPMRLGIRHLNTMEI